MVCLPRGHILGAGRVVSDTPGFVVFSGVALAAFFICSFRVMAGSFGPLTVLPISKSSVFCVFNSPGPECYLLRSPARSPHLGRFAVGLPHAAGKREALLTGGKRPAEVFHICGGNTYGWFDHGLFLHGFASRAL